MTKHTLFITSPLEREYVERIGKVAPQKLEIIYEQDLYPPLRYVCDHKGASFTRSAEQTAAGRLRSLAPTSSGIAHNRQPLEGAATSCMRSASNGCKRRAAASASSSRGSASTRRM